MVVGTKAKAKTSTSEAGNDVQVDVKDFLTVVMLPFQDPDEKQDDYSIKWAGYQILIFALAASMGLPES